MQVTYKVIGELKKKVVPDSGDINLPAGATVGQLVAGLGLPDDLHLVAVVDGRRYKQSDVLQDGQEVVLVLPSVGG
ncbi:thiamineS protein [Syntrophothermus lipocalidus DSM 12680]|uniref:ThiamineS protein n=1 Tax=Syntrophothermus lipocalidus (strain DSM 12680 / TGB-C1) TaxID=643648 RepID=D7CLH2_SYNLT|nr:thiamineS protein [Syntrophothermus lipocalidus DSM 12680]